MNEEKDTRSADEIEADLESTREHLAEAIDAMGAKLDVKTRSKEKVSDVKARSQEKAVQVKDDHGQELAIAGGVAAAALVAYVVWRIYKK